MDNPATTAVLTDRGHVLPVGVTPTLAQTRLDEAWRALQRESSLPGLVTRVEVGDLDVELVVDVVIAAALRVMRNPEGVESESGQIDDYSESRKLADATADLYFTAAELRRLAPVAQAPAGFSGSFKYC